MNFQEILMRLEKGETFEQILNGEIMVECNNNEVYEDDDLYEFLQHIGAEIKNFTDDYAVIKTNDKKYYSVPYANRENRFGKDLPEETILFFDSKRIKNITDID